MRIEPATRRTGSATVVNHYTRRSCISTLDYDIYGLLLTPPLLTVLTSNTRPGVARLNVARLNRSIDLIAAGVSRSPTDLIDVGPDFPKLPLVPVPDALMPRRSPHDLPTPSLPSTPPRWRFNHYPRASSLVAFPLAPLPRRSATP